MISINITQFSLDRVGQWPIRIRITMLLSFSVIIVFLGYIVFIQKQCIEYQQLKSQEAILKADFEKKHDQGTNLVKYRQQIKTMNDHFALVLKQLPERNELPALLNELSNIGISSGLVFKLFVPQPEKMQNFYVELPIKISLSGNYFNCAAFLSRVAAMKRIVTVHELSMEEKPSRNYQTGMGTKLEMNLLVKIYRGYS